jgi:hypothetical protein
MNLSELKKLRSVKDRAETVYWQAGGKKENLKKAILKGKGNSDKKVPMSGLDGLDNVYADEDEYNIIYNDDLEGLGEIASGTAIAAATSAVAAISGALKQIKGLFTKGGKDEQAFQSETYNAGTAASAPAVIPEDEDAFFDEPKPAPITQQASSLISKLSTAVKSGQNIITATKPITQITTKTNETTQSSTAPVQTTQSVLPGQPAASASMLVPGEAATTSVAVQTQDDDKKEGVLQKTTAWVKENPGKSLLVAGGIITGGYLLMNVMRGGSRTNGLEGLPKKTKRKNRKRYSRNSRKNKVKPQNLL